MDYTSKSRFKTGPGAIKKGARGDRDEKASFLPFQGLIIGGQKEDFFGVIAKATSSHWTSGLLSFEKGSANRSIK